MITVSVTPEDRALVEQCLDAYYQSVPKTLLVVPPAMRVDPLDRQEWVQWKMLPSTVSEQDVADLQAQLPAPLPPLFVAYLTTRHVLDMDFGEFWMPPLPVDRPLDHARMYLLDAKPWEAGYMPFAVNPYGDPVCFDFRSRRPDGDCPVVVINHERVKPFENWKNRKWLKCCIEEVAPSFREFFTALCLDD